MIERYGNFHWETIIRQIKAEDPTCGIDQDGLTLIVKNVDESKRAILESILDSHNADTALAAWNARQQRQTDAAPAIKDMPNWGTWTAQQAEDYVEAYVVNLATAKVIFKKMAKVLCYLRDHGGI